MNKEPSGNIDIERDKNERSPTDDNSTQCTGKVTKKSPFHFVSKVCVTEPRRPNKEKKKERKMTRVEKEDT